MAQAQVGGQGQAAAQAPAAPIVLWQAQSPTTTVVLGERQMLPFGGVSGAFARLLSTGRWMGLGSILLGAAAGANVAPEVEWSYPSVWLSVDASTRFRIPGGEFLAQRVAAADALRSQFKAPRTFCSREAVLDAALDEVEAELIPWRDFVATWARRNGCAAEPVDSALGAEVTRRAFGRCVGQADVVLYTVRGGGHTWPGGPRLAEWFVGHTSSAIDATRLMWDFFREHPLRR